MKPYSEQYQKWLALSDEEKENYIEPLPFTIDIGENAIGSQKTKFLAKLRAPQISEYTLSQEKIDEFKIQNKQQVDKINDYIVFPNVYKYKENGETVYTNGGDKFYTKEQVEEVKNYIKGHIVQYGAVTAYISTQDMTCFVNNGDKLSYYCDNKEVKPNMTVAIIGWDDNYEIQNFNVAHRPTKPGAYKVVNSEGQIIYVSYEDSLIESSSFGISTKAEQYDNLYEYDEQGFNSAVGYGTNEIYVANVFAIDPTKKEELNAISIPSFNRANYEVYVNAIDGSLDKDKLKLVKKSIEPLNTGYNTISLDEPIDIKGIKYAVVVKLITTNHDANVAVEQRGPYEYANVTAHDGESFISKDMENWEDLYLYNPDKQMNACIKAFTTSKVEVSEIHLQQQEITVPRNMTEKIETRLLPSVAPTNKVKWTSSDEKIAKVDKAGNVTGVSRGEAIITAESKTNPDIKATAKVNVTEPEITINDVSILSSKSRTVRVTIKIDDIGPENEVPVFIYKGDQDVSDKFNITGSGSSEKFKIDLEVPYNVEDGIYSVKIMCGRSSATTDLFKAHSDGSVLKSDRYKIDTENYIYNIDPGTTITEFKAEMETLGAIKVYNKNNQEILGDTLVGTAMKMKINNTEYQLGIKGDLMGIGEVSSSSLEKFKKHMTEIEPLKGVYLKAADINSDGTINNTDYAQFKELYEQEEAKREKQRKQDKASSGSSIDQSILEVTRKFVYRVSHSGKSAPLNADGTGYKMYDDGYGYPTIGDSDICYPKHISKFPIDAQLYINEKLGSTDGSNQSGQSIDSLNIEIEKSVVDKVGDQILTNFINYVERQTVGLGLNRAQKDALVAMAYRGGNIDGFKAAYEQYGNTIGLWDNFWYRKFINKGAGGHLKVSEATYELFTTGNYQAKTYDRTAFNYYTAEQLLSMGFSTSSYTLLRKDLPEETTTVEETNTNTAPEENIT